MDKDKLYNRDCIEGMSEIPAESIELAFADPPFNIGYEYDVYEDRRAADEYLSWTRKWGAALVRALKPDGTFWLAIGDDFAAELKLIFQKELKLCCRSWVIWYYTFGVNCKYKFSRSHTHLFHFVKDSKNFTFNRDKIRVPSARQLVYADARAHAKGRLPDDTWILRPQDAPQSFKPEEDVWYVPRVCGTFKERAGWHGCQMPEQLLGRIIKVSSNPGDTVLEPFGGSGTTLVVAKKLNRRFIGFELSKSYASQIQARLDQTCVDEALSGAEEPLVSAPATAREARKKAPSRDKKVLRSRQSAPAPADVSRGVVEAFIATRNGFSIDRVIADPELNDHFIAMCARLGLPGKPFDWNHRLMNLRKAHNLRGLETTQRQVLPFNKHEFYRYKFACEIGIQHFERECEASLDHVLCDPDLAKRFDEYVRSMLPDDPTSLTIRWFAFRIRKAADKISQAAAKLKNDVQIARNYESPFSLKLASIPESPGLYWLEGNSEHLYVGETDNLRERMTMQFGHRKFDFWGVERNTLRLSFKRIDSPVSLLPQYQSRWISKWRPSKNFEKLAAAR